jgi:hypothetical protein
MFEGICNFVGRAYWSPVYFNKSSDKPDVVKTENHRTPCAVFGLLASKSALDISHHPANSECANMYEDMPQKAVYGFQWG